MQVPANRQVRQRGRDVPQDHPPGAHQADLPWPQAIRRAGARGFSASTWSTYANRYRPAQRTR